MTPHVHMSPAHLVAVLAAVVALFGTAHLLSLTTDNRLTRAWAALGF